MDQPHRTIEELDRVRLRHPVEAEEGLLPAGASGTVVGVLGQGAAFIVEFIEPFAALVDVEGNCLDTIPGESRADLVAGRLVHRAS